MYSRRLALFFRCCASCSFEMRKRLRARSPGDARKPSESRRRTLRAHFSWECENCGLAGREMLSASAFARFIGVSREAVREKAPAVRSSWPQRRKAGLGFPKWQVTSKGGSAARASKALRFAWQRFVDGLSISHSTSPRVGRGYRTIGVAAWQAQPSPGGS
jgi:hypothetical protein